MKSVYINLFLILFLNSGFVYTQTSNSNVKVVDFEQRLQLANENLEKQKLMVEKSISTIDSGKQLIKDTKEEEKGVKQELKQIEKEYNNNLKSVEKQMDSDDKETVQQAKIEERRLDKEFAENSFKIKNQLKQCDTKYDRVETIIKKAKADKIKAIEKVKEAKKAVKQAEFLLKKAQKD